MKTNKILIIAVLILVLFFVIKKLKVEITPTTTTTTTNVVYRRNATPVARPNPHYNAYKAQYYN